jgi:hypothetical protein
MKETGKMKLPMAAFSMGTETVVGSPRSPGKSSLKSAISTPGGIHSVVKHVSLPQSPIEKSGTSPLENSEAFILVEGTRGGGSYFNLMPKSPLEKSEASHALLPKSPLEKAWASHALLPKSPLEKSEAFMVEGTSGGGSYF